MAKNTQTLCHPGRRRLPPQFFLFHHVSVAQRQLSYQTPGSRLNGDVGIFLNHKESSNAWTVEWLRVYGGMGLMRRNINAVSYGQAKMVN